MSKTGRSLMIALLSVVALAPSLAEAARIGGGRSKGMQRSQITRSAPPRQQQAVPPQQQPQQQPQQGQRSGPGWGGVAAGAAAGAVGGYMLGKAMDGNQASAPMSQSQPSSIPWGMIFLLGGLAVVGAMMLSRRRPQPASPFAPAGAPAAAFDQQQDRKVFRMGEGMGAPTAVSAMTRLPDGTETAAFLRQVRASFMHIQSLNSPDQLEEVRRYMTPDLFAALQAEISANRDLAEFPELNVDLLDAVTEGSNTVASVRFSGKVSESLHAPAVAFAEVWHFVRPTTGDPRWVLAGIQQE